MKHLIADKILNNESVRLIKDSCGDLLWENAFVCGGAIRNLCMGRDDVKDLDVFIDNRKVRFNEIIDRLKKIGRVEYGQYGAPRLYIDGKEPYIDIVPFTNFDGYGCPIDGVDDLLMNFDFTANAMGVNIMTGDFYDPVNGVKDIENKVLRAVRLDFPEMPVSDKIALSAVSVFWFRLLHYQNQLGFAFDEATELWIIDNKYRLCDLDEFKKYFFEPKISAQMMEKLH
jgi:hypothetical protein